MRFLFLIFLVILSGCSKNIFLPEKGGPNAFKIRTYSNLSDPSAADSSNLPKPKNSNYSSISSKKTKKSNQIIDISVNEKKEYEQTDALKALLNSKNISSKEIDLDEFDAQMSKVYEVQTEKEVTALDRIIGNDDDKILDPVLGTHKEESVINRIF